MAGGDPTLSDGFKASWSVITFIAAWAIVEATVGLVLKMLQGRGGRRNMITGTLGTMWTMASFFVTPRMVIDKIDPFTALKSAWKDVKGNLSLFRELFDCCVFHPQILLLFGIGLGCSF